MRNEKAQGGKSAAGGREFAFSGPTPRRAAQADWKARIGRPAATAVAVVLAMLLGWHVINGQNGVSPWLEKRVEERQLDKQVNDVRKENERLRARNQRLASDPDAIGMVARDQLHYVKPNEVSVILPLESKAPALPAAAGK